MEKDNLSSSSGSIHIGIRAENTDQNIGKINLQANEHVDLPVSELHQQQQIEIRSSNHYPSLSQLSPPPLSSDEQQDALLDVDKSNTRVHKRLPAIRRKKKSTEYRNVSV